MGEIFSRPFLSILFPTINHGSGKMGPWLEDEFFFKFGKFFPLP